MEALAIAYNSYQAELKKINDKLDRIKKLYNPNAELLSCLEKWVEFAKLPIIDQSNVERDQLWAESNYAINKAKGYL